MSGVPGGGSGPAAAGWRQTVADAVQAAASSEQVSALGDSITVPRVSLRLPAHAGASDVVAALASAIAREARRVRPGGDR